MIIALIGNGTFFECADILRKKEMIIAVDGGANHCKRMNISPDVIIGDGDSIIDDTLAFGDAADISGNEVHVESCRAHIGGDGLATFGAPAGTDDRRPPSGENFGDADTKAGRDTGDHNNFVGKIVCFCAHDFIVRFGLAVCGQIRSATILHSSGLVSNIAIICLPLQARRA